MKTTISLMFNIIMLISNICIDAIEHSHTDQANGKEITYRKYKIIDLGTLGSESSWAYAINEKGQILGTMNEKDTSYTFLWSPDSGLEVLNHQIPPYSHLLNSHLLNNHGQIAGNYYDYLFQCNRSFIWDNNNEFLDIGSLGGLETNIIAFNDSCQIIGMSKIKNKDELHAFIWNAGVMTDLTAKFKEHFPGNWSYISPASINNHGTVVINACLTTTDKNGKTNNVYKCFTFRNYEFTTILPAENAETSITCSDWDDNDNALINIGKNGTSSQFIINGNSKIPTNFSANIILNNQPTTISELSTGLKKDTNGNLYYGNRIDITKLLNIKEPFYMNFNQPPCILDQNSKGYAVGSIDTIHSGHHAFLGIPE